MTDPDASKDLELEPELELQPLAADAPAAGAAAGGDGGVEGQWVWQYGAPPPPPSFAAVFFSGTALKEIYRRFGCALLVVIGCLMPWGPVTSTVEDVSTNLVPPPVAGYETPLGAISLVLGLWLLFSSCYGIYTRRQKILPVFLMIEPAIVTWWRAMDAWGATEAEGALDQMTEALDVMGSGVLLALVGSTWVALGFLFLLGKVYAKKDDKGAARRASRTKKDGGSGKDAKDAKEGKEGKEGKDAKEGKDSPAKDAGKEAAEADKASTEGAADSESPATSSEGESAGAGGTSGTASDGKDEDAKASGGRGRGRRGRRR